MKLYRATLYLNGIEAIRTKPMHDHDIQVRVSNWQNIYGHRVKIEVEQEADHV